MAEALPALQKVVIECPICLEVLKEPKTLSCRHTFCDECLIVYIGSHEARSIEFPCPVCRRSTQVSGCSLKGKNWTEAFDTDDIIVQMLKSFELKEKTNDCHLCKKKENKISPAVVCCKDCGTYMCDLCENVHDFLLPSHSKRNLGTIAKEEHFLEIQPNNFRCEKHAYIKDMYCYDDDEIICVRCAAVLHRSCKKVVDIKDVTEDIKLKVSNDLKELKECQESLRKAIATRKCQMTCLKEEGEAVREKIVTRQKQVNRHFENLKSELDSIVLSEQTILESNITRYEKLIVAAEQSQKIANSCLKFGNYQQLKQCAGKIQNDIRLFNDETLDESDSRKNLRVIFSIPARESGKLNVFYSKTITGTYLEQPLHARSGRRNMYCIGVLSSLPERRHTCVTGMQFLDDGRLVLCEKINCKLQLYDINQPLGPLHEIAFQDSASVWGVCRMSENKVAVTHPTEKSISIVLVKGSSLCIEDRISVGKNVYGIDSKNDLFYVTCPDEVTNSVIEVWTHGGKKIRDIHEPLFKRKMWYLKINEMIRKVVVTQEGCTALILDFFGSVIHCIRHPMLPCGSGIAFDQENNLYICGTDSSNLLSVKLHVDSVEKGIVILEREIRNPVAVAVHKNIVAVSDGNGKDIRIYVMI